MEPSRLRPARFDDGRYGAVMARRTLVFVASGLSLLAAGVASARDTATLRIAPAVRGLDQPVLVTATPGAPGRLYVVEQTGRIRVVANGKVRAAPFLDVRSTIVSGGEQGLLGLAFPRDFAKSGRFAVNYTDRDGHTRIVAYRARGGRAVPGSAQVLLTVKQPYPNHNGGMIAFGPDGDLYVGMGDGGSGGDPENRAQNMKSLLGKLLRLDWAAARPRPVIVANGLRNPWRFSFDRQTGDLWIGDVGQSEIEEIDHLPRSSQGLVNFGWDVFEGRSRFEDKQPGPGRVVGPVHQYTHDEGCSVTGGYVYRGRKVPSARGRYFFGDYCSGAVWSLRLVAGATTDVRKEAFRVPSLSGFGEDAAGELYLVSHEGTIFRLEP
jgi:glucose/arabinose dehydrogenase